MSRSHTANSRVAKLHSAVIQRRNSGTCGDRRTQQWHAQHSGAHSGTHYTAAHTTQRHAQHSGTHNTAAHTTQRHTAQRHTERYTQQSGTHSRAAPVATDTQQSLLEVLTSRLFVLGVLIIVDRNDVAVNVPTPVVIRTWLQSMHLQHNKITAVSPA